MVLVETTITVVVTFEVNVTYFTDAGAFVVAVIVQAEGVMPRLAVVYHKISTVIHDSNAMLPELMYYSPNTDEQLA